MTNNRNTKIQTDMNSFNGFKNPYLKIFSGITMLIIALIYIADKLKNNADIRLFDWFSWIAMFVVAAILITEGIRIFLKK